MMQRDWASGKNLISIQSIGFIQPPLGCPRLAPSERVVVWGASWLSVVGWLVGWLAGRRAKGGERPDKASEKQLPRFEISRPLSGKRSK